jgi:dGTPase
MWVFAVRRTLLEFTLVHLAPYGSYDWITPENGERAHVAEPTRTTGDERSDYERDRSRIIHSVAFRKLQGKTQVFTTGPTTDFLRTRLTHSIEVAQIGRALAQRFGVPEALVEAACLGHDLGHPPFGHAGEQALNALMAEHGGFEGNAQTFRIVTYLEQKHPDYEGLDLCRLTLLSLIKYPYRRKAGAKKFMYEADFEREGQWLYRGTGQTLLSSYLKDEEPPRTLPCQLMDWADDIAYSVHDLEDGLAGGILHASLWDTDEFIDAIHRSVTEAPIRWQSGAPGRATVAAILRPMAGELGPYGPTVPKDVIREFSRRWIDRFATAGALTGGGSSPYDFRFDVPEEIRIENQVLKAITFEYLVRDHRTSAAAFRGKRIVRRLFGALLENTKEFAKEDRYLLFPRELRESLRSYEGDATDTARFACDYVAGLTEGQAVELYSRLFTPLSPLSGVST